MPAPDAPHPPDAPTAATPADAGAGEGSRPAPGRTDWTAGRIAAVVSGSLAVLVALGLFGAAGTSMFVDRVLRDDTGFVTSPQQTFSTSAYAITSDTIAVDAVGVDAALPERILGQARVRVTGPDDAAVFVGIASTADVRAYLDGVAYTTVTEVGDAGEPVYREQPGGAPSTAPADESIWVATAVGTGTQSVNWAPDNGDWTVVVMNSDGAPGVDVTADAAAELPVLGRLSTVLLVPAGVFTVAGIVLVALALARRKGEPS